MKPRILNCIQCSKELSKSASYYGIGLCLACFNDSKIGKERPEHSKRMSGENHPNYKDGKSLKPNHCLECNTIIHWTADRCPSCANKGANNPAWLGGLTEIGYYLFTKELKEKVRDRDNHICQNPDCGCTEIENGQALEVHHIDYDKKNFAEENLISLCKSCHMKTNTNRTYWTDFFSALLFSCSSF